MDSPTHRPRISTPEPSTRQGFAIIYVVLILVVLIGFVALGVDMGRLHLAKTELQVAADAAARAGAAKIPPQYGTPGDENQTAARSAATALANANNCEGTPVSPSSMAFYIWNPNRGVEQLEGTDGLKPLVYPDLREANAIQVSATRTVPLTFASVLGKTSAVVSVTAIAMARGRPEGLGFGIVGLDWIEMNGNKIATDSYLPELGSYDSQPPRSNGSVASNGDINLGNRDVNGDCRCGVPLADGTEYTITQKSQSYITGWKAPLDQPLSYPLETVPAGVVDQGDYKGDSNLVLTGSSDPNNPTLYCYNNFTMSGNKTVTVEGYVKLFIKGNLTITGTIDANLGIPAQLTISMVGTTGTAAVEKGTPQTYFHLYAPAADFVVKGTTDFYGWVIAKSLYFNGEAAVHYDESAQPSGGLPSFYVQLVK
ncbi:MAG TPA: pilus assembly protein TadG-related protein [Tepidisphaeraceae bacterium]|nr:pilus assembly protein TadG-related protein [Tepidisphaeraceae bacterium]